jgi:hypothetical protein
MERMSLSIASSQTLILATSIFNPQSAIRSIGGLHFPLARHKCLFQMQIGIASEPPVADLGHECCCQHTALSSVLKSSSPQKLARYVEKNLVIDFLSMTRKDLHSVFCKSKVNKNPTLAQTRQILPISATWVVR